MVKKAFEKTIARARARVSHRARPNTSSIYKIMESLLEAKEK